MADQLYVSFWFPNFRLFTLPSALRAVLHQFARVAADGSTDGPYTRVAAATVFPIDWTESPTWQRIFVNDPRSRESEDSSIDKAVAEATEQLHDDCAYEFEMHLPLWMPDDLDDEDARAAGGREDFDSGERGEEHDRTPTSHRNVIGMDGRPVNTPPKLAADGWHLRSTRVHVTGFGPDFDGGAYDTNGHIRVDFGLDTPWTLEDLAGDESADAVRAHIKANVEKLLAFTLLVEKHCGISSRLLWTESGEPLAEKLVAQLQRVN